MSSSRSTNGTRSTAGSRLGTWIRATRTEQTMSQRALADRAGLSRSYVCDIERGRGAQPSVATLDKLAAALGASRSDLLKASGLLEPTNGKRETDEERRMLAVYRDLTDQGRGTVMRFARFVHADEHAWVQSQLTDGALAEGESNNLAKGFARSLFERDDS